MEKDDEMGKGDGNSYTTEFRQYDPRLGRWLSIDPVTHAMYSPCNAYDNNPIYFKDPSGADGEPTTTVKKGEGPSQVAARTEGVSTQDIVDWNPSIFPDGLEGDWGWHPGDKVNISNPNQSSAIAPKVKSSIPPNKPSIPSPIPPKSLFQSFLDNTRIVPNSQVGSKHIFRKEVKTQIVNPFKLGVLTTSRYTETSVGDGFINIKTTNGGTPEPSFNSTVLGVSLTLAPSGLSLSIGLQNALYVGYGQDGVTFGYSRKKNGVVSGTQFSWQPGFTFDMMLAPVKGPSRIPVPL